MAQYQTFDIVVVPFPYSDRLAEKRRPAVIVSHPILEESQYVVWLAMITSSAAGATEAISLTDIEVTGLHRASFVRPSKIATLEMHRIMRKAGKLSDSDATRLMASLKKFAGF